jgi:hypothetical protein
MILIYLARYCYEDILVSTEHAMTRQLLVTQSHVNRLAESLMIYLQVVVASEVTDDSRERGCKDDKTFSIENGAQRDETL